MKVTAKDYTKDDLKENVESVEHQRWSEIPHVLLEIILSPLKQLDIARASVVCKHWNTVASGIRVLHQSPWLMNLTETLGFYQFYDPINHKTHFVDLPEIANSRVCYNKDGWLLLYKIKGQYFYFFNPFTRELINLPKKRLENMIVAFSAAPTSGDCIVFTLKHVIPDGIFIIVSTCHPGATEWTTVQFQNRDYYYFDTTWNMSLFCQRKFYCYSSAGWFGVYDHVERTWNTFSIAPPHCLISVFAHWGRDKFMTEYNGDIFIIYTSFKENPTLHKLDEANRLWKEIKTVDGGTFFVSCSTCHFGVNFLGLRRNSIYFPKFRFYGKRCIFYSLDDHRYYPRKQCPEWKEEDTLGSIWINTPEVFAGFV